MVVNSINTFIRRYKQSGVIKKPPGIKPKKLSSEQVKVLNSWFDENCLITLDDAKDKVKENFGIEICIETIRNYLNKLNFSFKRISVVPVARNDPTRIAARKEYARNFMTIQRHRENFFLDETGIAVHAVNYGWSRIGERANVKTRAVRGKHFSICAAINYRSLYFYEAKEKGYDTEHFVTFLNQFLRFLERDDIKEAYIIMENVPFHHSTGVKDTIEGKGHNLIFLPAYSPFLNPIENMFNQLKYYVKRFNPNTPDDVFHGVDLASEMVVKNDCINYYENMMIYIGKSLEGEIINN
ncbi:uncharacterized protein LOC128394858 [Panonychus citri]|uniref:uncharacterized protein LOC128394858 n=1 Tax=Panonychus citri TaxID=50023 RepID=UPI0023079CA2|nr:uncharacterized protein LOC128394858 [Panonychus citri]